MPSTSGSGQSSSRSVSTPGGSRAALSTDRVEAADAARQPREARLAPWPTSAGPRPARPRRRRPRRTRCPALAARQRVDVRRARGRPPRSSAPSRPTSAGCSPGARDRERGDRDRHRSGDATVDLDGVPARPPWPRRSRGPCRQSTCWKSARPGGRRGDDHARNEETYQEAAQLRDPAAVVGPMRGPW